MESKQFAAFDEELFHLLTKHFGDKWSYVWAKTRERILLFKGVVTQYTYIGSKLEKIKKLKK